MEDKQLFELWENKIKVELTSEITSNKLRLWSLFHNIGHRVAARFLEDCHIASDDMILEIGCGNCNFTKFLKKERLRNYVGLDISQEMLALAESGIRRVQADLYSMPFTDGSAKVIVSIYNLEHLHRIDNAIDEIFRVLSDDGTFLFVIPMENGFLYNLGRNLTTRRIVEKRYGIDYMKIIREYEHPNSAEDIVKKIDKRFHIKKKLFWPFFMPSVNLNILGVFLAVKK